MVSKIDMSSILGLEDMASVATPEVGDYSFSARNAKAKWLKCGGYAVRRHWKSFHLRRGIMLNH